MDLLNEGLLNLPDDDEDKRYEMLAYVEALDAIENRDYAFLAWKETDIATGQWRVRVQSAGAAGALFEPAMLEAEAAAFAAEGREWFVSGPSIEAVPGDPRNIEYRVHLRGGRPAEIEIHVVLRNPKGRAAPPRTARFAWPGYGG